MSRSLEDYGGRDLKHRRKARGKGKTVSRGAVLSNQAIAELLRELIPYILFGAVFLFVGLCACGVAVMRRRSGPKFLVFLGIWSAIEGTEYLFGSLADLGLLPSWLLSCLPYVGNVLSFSVIVIALLAFLQLSRGKLRLFLKGVAAVGLVIAVAGIALFLSTGSSFKVMPYNHLLAAISLVALGIAVVVPRLSHEWLILPNRGVLRFGIMIFVLEAVYGNLSLPFGLPSPPEILDPAGFAVLLFCFGYAAVQNLEPASRPAAGAF